MGRRRQAAVNAVIRPMVEYLPDHHGAILASRLSGVTNADLNAKAVVHVPYPTWNGVTQQQQHFTGVVAAPALGTATPITQRSSELSRESTSVDPSAAAIFASRMARR